MRTHYQVLGVSQTATQQEIEEVADALAQMYENGDARTVAQFEQRHKEIETAYLTLSDIEKRAEYDRELEETEKRLAAKSSATPFTLNDLIEEKSLSDGIPPSLSEEDDEVNNQGMLIGTTLVITILAMLTGNGGVALIVAIIGALIYVYSRPKKQKEIPIPFETPEAITPTRKFITQEDGFAGYSPRSEPTNISPELEYHVRMVNESVDIIDSSTEAKTMLYRLGFLEENLNEVLKIIPDNESAMQMYAMLPEIRRKVHTKAVVETVKKLSSKAELAKLASTKQRYAKEALIMIDAAMKTGIADQKTVMAEANGLRRYIAQVEIDEYVGKAKRHEFKGQKSKALEFYKDALYSALNDDIPDGEQSDVIEHLKSKLAELEQNG